MHILIVSCVFPPEPVVSARTSADLAQELYLKRNEVQVITAFPNRPAGKLYAGYKQKIFARERHTSGYKILRCFSFLSPQSSLVSRFLENFSFGVFSGLAVLFLERPDVVYANTWPIFAQGILSLVCRLRDIPLILSIQDLYPESLFVQKRVGQKASWILNLLRRLDVLISINAALLIVISKKLKKVYVNDRKISENKFFVIPNWIDEDRILLGLGGSRIREQHGIPSDSFLVVYGGNISVAAGVTILVKSFQDLVKEIDPYLLIAGSGSMLNSVVQLAHDKNASHVYFHSPWLEEETSEVLSAADLLALPTQGDQSLVSVPSKLLTYMLSTRPVLAMANPDSDVADVVRNSGCGWVISPDDPEMLRNEIVRIASLGQEERDQRGQAGRDFVLKYFSLKKNLPEVLNLIEKLGSKL